MLHTVKGQAGLKCTEFARAATRRPTTGGRSGMGIQDWWMLGRLAAATLALSGALATPPGRAQAETYERALQSGRHALVIGNARHVHLAALPSAREDMQRVSEQPKALGFAVTSIDGLASADIFNDQVLTKVRSQLPKKWALPSLRRHEGAFRIHEAPLERPQFGGQTPVQRTRIELESVGHRGMGTQPGDAFPALHASPRATARGRI